MNIVSSKHSFFSRGFTLMELLVVIAILGILATIGLGAFASSQTKSRDSRRKTDLKNIAVALETYYNDNAAYPVSAAGKIVGCAAAACEWGSEWKTGTTIYMATLPIDKTAYNYYYYSDGSRYVLYARLENSNDLQAAKTSEGAPGEYGGSVCADGVKCNFAITSTNSPAPTVTGVGEEDAF